MTLDGSAGDPVVGATVTVTGGPTAGLNGVTDWEGRYKIFGVAGPATVRVAKAGYLDRTGEIAVAGNETLDVALPMAGPLPSVAGACGLTAAADPACAGNLPEAARVREYAATIVRNGSVAEVRLTGANWDQAVPGHGDRFPGRVEPESVTFQLAEIDYWGGAGPMGPYLGELLSAPPGSWLVLSGRVLASITGDSIEGTLAGDFVLYDRSIHAVPRSGQPIGSCASERHRFSFRRR